MVVGVLRLDLRLHGVQSLKEKRGIVQKLLARCRNRYPVSCAEIDYQDLWQRAGLGFAVLSSSEQVVAPILERLEDDVADSGLAELIKSEIEFIHC
ncbi:MAG: DUF503 domain-containing protein [Desulfuromonadales bacterium]|nr:DUF503 domain-containing protein [Desulfuromonadales bacterium]